MVNRVQFSSENRKLSGLNFQALQDRGMVFLYTVSALQQLSVQV